MNIFTRMFLNKKDQFGRTALWWAAYKGDSNQVGALIAANAHINAQDKEGETPLIVAVRYKHAHVIKTLIAAGADVNEKDKEGNTALLIASESGLEDCVIELIAAGADVNAKKKHSTVLMSAITYCGVACVKSLIAAGASVKAEDNNNSVVLAGTTKDLDMVTTLISAGADVNAMFNIDGRTILMDAASGDDASVEVVKTLIDAGANVNVRDKSGNTVLTWKWAPKKTEIISIIRTASRTRSQAQRYFPPQGLYEPVQNLAAIVREASTGLSVEESIEKVSAITRDVNEKVDGFDERETRAEAQERVRITAREFIKERGSSWDREAWLSFHLKIMVQQTVAGSYGDLATAEISNLLEAEARSSR